MLCRCLKQKSMFAKFTAAAAAKLLQSCPTLCDSIDGSLPGSCPWDSPGKNTGVGCHFLLQCRKVKTESEVAQLCPTPSNPMDCSLPGSSIHGIFQARVLEWGAIAFSVRMLQYFINIDRCQLEPKVTFPEDSGAGVKDLRGHSAGRPSDDRLKGQLEENLFLGKLVGSPDLNQLTGLGQGARQF